MPKRLLPEQVPADARKSAKSQESVGLHDTGSTSSPPWQGLDNEKILAMMMQNTPIAEAFAEVLVRNSSYESMAALLCMDLVWKGKLSRVCNIRGAVHKFLLRKSVLDIPHLKADGLLLHVAIQRMSPDGLHTAMLAITKNSLAEICYNLNDMKIVVRWLDVYSKVGKSVHFTPIYRTFY